MSLTVITPVSREVDWLRETASSVQRLAELLPIKVRWVLCSDGPSVEWIDSVVSDLGSVETVVVPAVDLPADTVGRASLARNRGLDFVESGWVGFVDDDDWFDVDGYSAMVRFALENEYKWVVGRHVCSIDGELFPATNNGEEFVGEQEIGSLRRWMVERRVQPFVGAAGVMDADWYVANGGFPVLPYHQDTQLWLNASDAFGGYVLDETVYVWRRHNSQMTPRVLGTRPPMWR